jgi:hypothetical protein
MRESFQTGARPRQQPSAGEWNRRGAVLQRLARAPLAPYGGPFQGTLLVLLLRDIPNTGPLATTTTTSTSTTADPSTSTTSGTSTTTGTTATTTSTTTPVPWEGPVDDSGGDVPPTVTTSGSLPGSGADPDVYAASESLPAQPADGLPVSYSAVVVQWDSAEADYYPTDQGIVVANPAAETYPAGDLAVAFWSPEAAQWQLIAHFAPKRAPTTTTTAAPELGPCPGSCRWSWDEGTLSWTKLDSSTCASPCACDPPQVAGTLTGGDCDEIATRCHLGAPATCIDFTAQTTPSPGATTTSAAPDASTTTTPHPCAANTGCIWVCEAGAWQLLSSGCGDCPCPQPIGACNDCVQTDTQCYQAPPPPPCMGNCVWFWSLAHAAWELAANGCMGGQLTGCVCSAPAQTGDEVCGELAGVPCQPLHVGPTTTCAPVVTTTQAPATNCVAGRCRWRWAPNPTTTASGTTAPPAGTTSAPWDGTWVLLFSNCPDCTCPEPKAAGTNACETTETVCKGTTTSTTFPPVPYNCFSCVPRDGSGNPIPSQQYSECYTQQTDFSDANSICTLVNGPYSTYSACAAVCITTTTPVPTTTTPVPTTTTPVPTTTTTAAPVLYFCYQCQTFNNLNEPVGSPYTACQPDGFTGSAGGGLIDECGKVSGPFADDPTCGGGCPAPTTTPAP